MSFLRQSQSTGNLDFIDDTGRDWALGQGWAGNNSRAGDNPNHLPGRNNPALQAVHNIGPLPQGWYDVGAPITHPHLGPLAFPLTPDPSNEMFGRSDFFIHGAGGADPANASKGCIIQAHAVREHLAQLVDAGTTRLQVVA